eukprot:Colp12_sorted_trinity150504_noHs@20336
MASNVTQCFIPYGGPNCTIPYYQLVPAYSYYIVIALQASMCIPVLIIGVWQLFKIFRNDSFLPLNVKKLVCIYALTMAVLNAVKIYDADGWRGQISYGTIIAFSSVATCLGCNIAFEIIFSWLIVIFKILKRKFDPPTVTLTKVLLYVYSWTFTMLFLALELSLTNLQYIFRSLRLGVFCSLIIFFTVALTKYGWDISKLLKEAARDLQEAQKAGNVTGTTTDEDGTDDDLEGSSNPTTVNSSEKAPVSRNSSLNINRTLSKKIWRMSTVMMPNQMSPTKGPIQVDSANSAFPMVMIGQSPASGIEGNTSTSAILTESTQDESRVSGKDYRQSRRKKGRREKKLKTISVANRIMRFLKPAVVALVISGCWQIYSIVESLTKQLNFLAEPQPPPDGPFDFFLSTLFDSLLNLCAILCIWHFVVKV